MTACSSRSGDIEVVNNSGQTISNVAVTFNGGKADMGTLQANEIRRQPIVSQGESHAMLSFVDANGMNHDKLIDVYFEPTYRGVLRLTIDSTLNVKWTSGLSP